MRRPRSASSSSPSSRLRPSPLARVSTTCNVLRHVCVTSIADILKFSHVNDTFRDALESWSPTFWRRVAAHLEASSLDAFFSRDAFLWAAHNLLTVGQLDTSRMASHPLLIAAARGAIEAMRLCIATLPTCVDVCDERGNSALHLASFNSRIDCVRELLAEGADITVADNLGTTALLAATERANVEIVRLLVAHPDFDKIRDERRSDGRAALHLASRSGFIGCVRELLAAGADVAVACNGGWTALHYAADRGNASIVRLFVLHPDFAKIRDARGNFSQTALFRASHNGYVECVRELLAAGADISITAGRGETALHLSSRRDRSECVGELIAAGADITVISNYERDTVLHWAAHLGNVEVVRLLAAHADFAKIRNERNRKGETALHLASHFGYPIRVRELLAAGADVAVTSNSGWTALHYASQQGHVEILRHFIAHADFQKIRDKRNCDGWTALHVASRRGRTEGVRELLAAGANIAVTDAEGETVLHEAAAQGHVDVVRLLVERADDGVLNACNTHGATALDVAKTEEIKRLLSNNM